VHPNCPRVGGDTNPGGGKQQFEVFVDLLLKVYFTGAKILLFCLYNYLVVLFRFCKGFVFLIINTWHDFEMGYDR
jgi:hypothetical protein